MTCSHPEKSIDDESKRFGAGDESEDELDDDVATVQERFSAQELSRPDQQLAKKRGLDANSLGLRYPIWYSACRFDKFVYNLTSKGLKERGTDFLLLQSLGDPDSWANTQLKHPDLKALPSHILKYLIDFHSDDLDLVWKPYKYKVYVQCMYILVMCSCTMYVLYRVFILFNSINDRVVWCRGVTTLISQAGSNQVPAEFTMFCRHT
jgi:hypothetical protein